MKYTINVKNIAVLFIFVLLLFTFVPSSFSLRPDPADSREIVLYSRGFAEIRETRTVEITSGEGEILLPMLPESTYGSTIILEVEKPAKGVETRSVAFAYEQVDEDNYWQSLVGDYVELDLGDSVLTGILHRTTSLYLFVEPDAFPGIIHMIDMASVIDPYFAQLPGHLVTEPSIRWSYKSNKDRKTTLNITYMVGDLNWSADYRVLLYNKKASLTGQTILENDCGISFPYDKLVLVGGEIHLAGDKRQVDRINPKPGAAGKVKSSEFGDLRRWTVDEPGMLYNSHETMLPFIQGENLEWRTRYVYDATIFNDRVTKHLDLVTDANETGPLPSGKVRIYKKDDDGKYLLIGEDNIDDTPAGSPLDLTMSQVFDISAERIRMKEESVGGRGTKQHYNVVLGNSGSEDTVVEVLERMFGDWTITSENVDGFGIQHEVKDARTAKFLVNVPAGQVVNLEYDIEYWR